MMIIVYLGGGHLKYSGKLKNRGAKIDKDTKKRQFPTQLS